MASTNTSSKAQERRDSQYKAPMLEASPFARADDFRVRLKGFSGTATAGTTTDTDCKITSERWINGVQLILKNQVAGDKVHFEIVDKDGVFEGVLYPIGTPLPVVLDRFADSWYVSESSCQGIVTFNYPSHLYAGLYVRVKYVSTGATNVGVYINLFLHMKETL